MIPQPKPYQFDADMPYSASKSQKGHDPSIYPKAAIGSVVLHFGKRIELAQGNGNAIPPLVVYQDHVGYIFPSSEASIKAYEIADCVHDKFIQEQRRLAGYDLPGSRMTVDQLVTFIYNKASYSEIDSLATIAIAYVREQGASENKRLSPADIASRALGTLFAHLHSEVDLVHAYRARRPTNKAYK